MLPLTEADGEALDEPDADTLLRSQRESIDRLDAVLIYTLAERFRLTNEVGQIKVAHGLPAADPSRESAQITRLQSLARQSGLDPDFAKLVLEFIIREVIRRHRREATKPSMKGN